MSREIKFRVWSEEDREYRTDCRLTELFTSETGTPATVYSDEGDRFDIEQYTGLKDKNGKEIYEGDLLKCKGTYGDDFYFEVFWGGDGWFLVNYRTIGRTISLHDDSARLGFWFDREVIGNIHEYETFGE